MISHVISINLTAVAQLGLSLMAWLIIVLLAINLITINIRLNLLMGLLPGGTTFTYYMNQMFVHIYKDEVSLI